MYTDIQPFVDSNPPPLKKPHGVEERLQEAVTRNPTSLHVVKGLCEYQGHKRNMHAHKELRRFRKWAVKRGGTFFQTAKAWLLTPSTSPPTMGSARRCILQRHIRTQVAPKEEKEVYSANLALVYPYMFVLDTSAHCAWWCCWWGQRHGWSLHY